MTHEEIIEKLKDDSNYYGDFGKQFLSNSDIGTLFTNPLEFQKQSVNSVNLVIGSYLHTCVLEPHKLTSFKIIDISADKKIGSNLSFETEQDFDYHEDITIFSANREDALQRAARKIAAEIVMRLSDEW